MVEVVPDLQDEVVVPLVLWRWEGGGEDRDGLGVVSEVERSGGGPVTGVLREDLEMELSVEN